MVLNGLRDYGEEKLARKIAEKYHFAISRLYESTGTIWENIPPDQCEKPSPRAGRDFCGWSALGPISVWREFLNN
jgi:neutral trehalase